MGARGPKPGQYRMRPTPAGSPVVAGKAGGARYTPGAPEMPKHLGKGARAVWKRTVAEMERAGTLTHADRDILAAFCVAVADLESLVTEIDASGRMIDSPTVDRNGRLTGATVRKVNPALKWQAEASARVQRLAAELGLTPASRSRVNAPAEAQAAAGNKVIALRDQIAAIRRGENPTTTGNKVLDVAARFQAAGG